MDTFAPEFTRFWIDDEIVEDTHAAAEDATSEEAALVALNQRIDAARTIL